MNKRYGASIGILFVLSFLCAFSGFGQGKFIQNMGQWPAEIASRAEITGGAIYLCKNQLKYNFVDTRDFALLHADPYHNDTSVVHGQAFFFDWLNSNPNAEISSQNVYPEYYNYFIGNDPSQWKSGVHAYSDVTYKSLYEGVDLDISADGTDLEYTYTVHAGINPDGLKIKIEGADKVSIQNGDLNIHSPMVQIIEKSPYAYQEIEGVKVSVPCHFVISNGNIESFDFPEGYDRGKPLIIDPVVIFASYSGSKADNFGFTGTYDTLGYGYSGGDVYGAGYPTTPGAYMQTFQGGQDYSTYPGDPGYIEIQVLGFSPRDVAILKYTPDGKSLVYATYLGGKTGNEQPHSMVVDKSGDLVVFGTTASSDFPVTSSAYKSTLGGKTDLFISRFSPDGKKLLASTYMGGSGFDGLNGVNSWHNSKGYIVLDAGTPICYNYGDQFRGEVISDNSDNVYVATSTMSTDFPTTTGCYQSHLGGGTQDGCVFKLDSNLHKLVWSTYLGGAKDDGAYSLNLDSKNNVLVCGGTLSPYFFSKKDTTYQDTLMGSSDAFICDIKSDGSRILKSTYLGTSSYEQAYFVRLDQSDNVYVYGQTESKSFPVFNVKYSNPKSGNFITKFDDSLKTIIYSSVFGSGKGSPDISPTAFLIDKCERVYISGWGGLLGIYHPSLNKLGKVYGMPITEDAFQKVTLDSEDFYVAVFEKNMDSLLYSSYFGGGLSGEHVDGGTSRFDKNGIIYQSVCGGCEGNSDFPTTPGAWSRTNNSSGCNNLLFKVNLKISTLRAAFITPIYSCLNVVLKITNNSSGAQTYLWDFGDGTPKSTDSLPSHTYSVPGTYILSLVVTNPNSCQYRDTITKKITVYKNAHAAFNVLQNNCSSSVQFVQTGESNTSSWDFGDGSHSDSLNGIHTYAAPGTYTVRLVVDSGTSCVDSFSKTINVTGLLANFTDSLGLCQPNAVYFKNLSNGIHIHYYWLLPLASTDTARNTFLNFGNHTGTFPVTLVISDSTGCADTITKSITVYPKPVAGFSDSLYPCSSNVLVENQSEGINHFKWYFSDGTHSDLNSLVHQFPMDTTVMITLVTDSGSTCADTLRKSIPINYPKADFKFNIDTCSGEVQFTNKSSASLSTSWKFDAKDTSNLPNPVFTYITKGKYPVRLTTVSASGCVDSITKLISIENSKKALYIPNVFTPNNDAHNNTFEVTGLNPCNVYDFAIYNRWGQEFYHGEGNDFSWNGFYKGIKVPEGVYYYVLTGKTISQITGTITVIY